MLFLIFFVSVAFIIAFLSVAFIVVSLLTDFHKDYLSEEANYMITMDWNEED